MNNNNSFRPPLVTTSAGPRRGRAVWPAAAAEWYRDLGLPLPSNCWVEGNPPIPFEQIVQDSPVETWDQDYRARARRYPVFLAADPLVGWPKGSS